jgi:hypothetical protein
LVTYKSDAHPSGDKQRNNKARIAAVAADPATAAELLQRAAALSRAGPLSAYDLLYPGNRTAISDFGPAFLTACLCTSPAAATPLILVASSMRTSPWLCARHAAGSRCLSGDG